MVGGYEIPDGWFLARDPVKGPVLIREGLSSIVLGQYLAKHYPDLLDATALDIAAALADITATCKTGKLARFEIPQKVILIDELWTPDNGMLTAVMKLKRVQIVEKHRAQINSTYV